MRKFIPFIIFGVILVVILIKLWPTFGNFFPTATHIVFHPGATLKKTNGKTNVLLLGIGGGNHDGPNLTDTMILASIDWKKDTVTLISVPRDLWVPSLPGYVKKINSAYQIGLDESPPNGLRKAESIVSQVTGQPVHYGIRLDFQGFIDAINQIGGINVNVVRTLDDYNYPISGKEDDTCGHSQEELQMFTATLSAALNPDVEVFTFFPCRFKHLHFDVGIQHMDGETALEYARSRHGVGIEGSDFARSARQQLVIEAVRNKLISSALFNPGEILGLYGILKNSIDTDMNSTDIGLFLDKLVILKNAKIVTANIDTGDYTTGRVGLLDNAPISSEYDFSDALIPRIGNGNYSEIQEYVTCEVTKGNCTVARTPIATPTGVK